MGFASGSPKQAINLVQKAGSQGGVFLKGNYIS
jgi:hypothetical protein